MKALRMTHLRWSAALAGLVATTLLAGAGTSAGHAPRPGAEPSAPVLPRLMALDARGATPPSTAAPASKLVGSDGQLYDLAPIVVSGVDDQVFYGPDFDTACSDGPRFKKGLKRLARLARLIERSGRRVVLTVAPNKSSAYPGSLDQATLPHGRCTRWGLRRQERAMDGFRDERYLPLRERLVADPRQTYYDTDSHWTTVGASVFAKQLAKRLDRSVARRQHYTLGEETRQGDLFLLSGIAQPEVAQYANPTVKVKVRVSDSDPDLQQSWRSGPRKRVVDGKVLMLGDSFTYVGLGALRPLFREGRFIWTVPQNLPAMAEQLVTADVVVIEVLQRFVSTSLLGTGGFYREVKRSLLSR